VSDTRVGVLADPGSFVDGVPHDLLAQLRATDPVSFQPMDGEPGFYAVLRHADVVSVARDPETYSASLGGVVVEDLAPADLEMMRHMLLAMDPPQHSAHRAPLSDRFKGRVIAAMAPRIRGICNELFDELSDRDEVEFVHDLTARIPARVIGELMGLPPEDWDLLHRLSERQAAGQDADVAAGDGEVDHSASVEMAMYAIELATQRRAEPPREDLTSLILDAEVDGAPMSEVDFGSFFVQLVTAGNDTSRTMLSSGTLALLQHPDQLQALRDDPSGIPVALEELLRWANPLHYFRRTTTRATELGGVELPAGAKVAMYYTSANRDEEVFEDSQHLDLTRHPNPHLSFGIGAHFCLGVHLARLEGRVFFEELLARFAHIELAGEPVRLRSNLNNGLKRLPVHLRPR